MPEYNLSRALRYVLLGASIIYPTLSNAQSPPPPLRIIKWTGHGLKLEVQAMSLDVVRGFFLGRGFDKDNADFIAQTGCVFRSKMGHARNKPTEHAITVELAKWQVIIGNNTQSARTRQDWQTIWASRNIPEEAKTAFHWALFPTRQSYQSTDYNWGMISFALPPATKFDLKIYWLDGGKQHSKILKGLKCGN